MSADSAALDRDSALNRLVFQGRHAVLVQLLPALLLMTVLFVIPLVLFLVVSFWRFTPGGVLDATKPTLENYARYITHPYYRGVVARTLELGGVTAGACLLLGYPLAYIFARFPLRFKNFFMFLLLTPLFVSVVVRSIGWIVIMDHNGLLNYVLLELGVIRQPLRILETMSAVVVGLVNVQLTFAVMPIYSSLVNIPRSYEEAAQSLGATPLVSWARVTLPLSLPGVIAAWFLAFALTVNSYVQPSVLGGPTFQVMATTVYQHFNATLNWPFAAATGFLLLVIGLLAAVLPPWIVRRFLGSAGERG